LISASDVSDELDADDADDDVLLPDDDEDDDEEEEEEEDEDEDEEEEEDEELEDLGRSSEPRRRRLVCVRWSIGEHVPFDEFPGELLM